MINQRVDSLEGLVVHCQELTSQVRKNEGPAGGTGHGDDKHVT